MTAKELIYKYVTNNGIEDVHDDILSVEDCMIKFAQYHCQELLKEILSKGHTTYINDVESSYGIEVSERVKVYYLDLNII